MKALILSGYGQVGSAIAEILAKDTRVSVTIGGRILGKGGSWR